MGDHLNIMNFNNQRKGQEVSSSVYEEYLNSIKITDDQSKSNHNNREGKIKTPLYINIF